DGRWAKFCLNSFGNINSKKTGKKYFRNSDSIVEWRKYPFSVNFPNVGSYENICFNLAIAPPKTRSNFPVIAR
ncbi:hypothetical protein ACN4EE_23265, partial [Geminocystis sp. CENA526]|uniref:hypothetical protein n=1 Tax=Geminocystis sp. CENA526 TaxID=1355871 RepID=UPI003D6E9AE8